MDRRQFLKSSAMAGALSACNIRTNRSSERRPNILLCIADDVSFPHMGGCSWVKTPGFDLVAAEGLLFNRAYTPNAKCAPSRSCLLTGRNSWQLEEAANHWCNFPAKFKTFAECLSEHGYFVGYTAKGWGPGNPGKVGGKPRQLTGAPFNSRKAKPPAEYMADNDYAGNFEHFLSARPQGQPFCFWYGCLEPHRPYQFRAGIERGGKRTADIDRVFSFWPDNETVRADMLDYAYGTEHFDRHLGRMLEKLDKSGELENTLVVVTADNGMPFPRVKGQAYESSNHLPLAIMWKGGITKAGRTADEYVSFIDLAPTFLAVAGIEADGSGMQAMEGTSLTDLFAADKAGVRNRDFVLIGKERHDVGRPHDWGFPIRGIIRDDVLYLRNFEPGRWPSGNPETGYLNCDGSPTKTECLGAKDNPATRQYWEMSFGFRGEEEMYDLKEDRDCVRNLTSDPVYASLKLKLREELFERLKRQQDPRMFGRGEIFDQYPYVDEGSKNFYERFMKGENLAAGWVNQTDFEKR
jgi:N-sulfoglucosamine sulfohydrolase